MQALLYCCCGVDVHENMIEACILKGESDNPKILHRQFKTLQDDLISFTLWLYENECYHIAMESTGVYWRPVYEAIETYSHYVESVIVTNAYEMRNLPGRKTDIKDAEWIATLLRHGLLRHSFIPEKNIRNLREASRLYKKMVAEKSRFSNRIEKLLQAHGFKLSSVLSDILCKSGRNILNVLADRGSLTATDISQCLKGKTKCSAEEIHSAVSGELNEYERQMLKLLLRRITTLDEDIVSVLDIMASMAQPYTVQLSQIDSVIGIDRKAALLILAEISASPQDNFSTSERLCSWAGLSPRNDESAGKVKSRKILPGNPYIKSILCQVAWVAASNRKNNFGQWFWSHQGKMGKKKAIVAVSRKILTTIYVLLRDGTFYDPVVALSHIR